MTIVPDALALASADSNATLAYTFNTGTRGAVPRPPKGVRADGIRGLLHLTFRRFQRKEDPLLVAFLMLELADLEDRYGGSPQHPFSTWKAWAGRRAAFRAAKWLAVPENREHLARLRANRMSKQGMQVAARRHEQLRDLLNEGKQIDDEREHLASQGEGSESIDELAASVHQALRRLGERIITAAVRVGLLLDPAKNEGRLLFSPVVRAALPSRANPRRTDALVLDPAWVDAGEKARPIRRRRQRGVDAGAESMHRIRPSDASNPAVGCIESGRHDASDPAANRENQPREFNRVTQKRSTAASRGAVPSDRPAPASASSSAPPSSPINRAPRHASAPTTDAWPPFDPTAPRRLTDDEIEERRAREAFRRELEAAAPT